MSDVLQRLRALVFHAREERDMGEELRYHVEMQTERNVRAGMHPREARRRALIAFGGVERFKEDVRDARGTRWLENLRRDVRYALRRLTGQPGFTVPAVLTLAIGIGAVAAIFTLVDAVLLHPLPYPHANRLVAIQHTAPGLGISRAGLSDGIYLHYLKHNRVFEAMGLYHETNLANLTDGENAERIHLALITPSVFSVLGARPLLGRLFTPADTVAGAPRVVVISHALWVQRYGADPEIIGRTIELDHTEHTVIGVMPPGFDFPTPQTQAWEWWFARPWPMIRAGGLEERGIARLKPGISLEDARADLQRLIPSLADAYPDVTPADLSHAQLRAEVISLKDAVVGDVRASLVILLYTVGFVLLIALANVANLFLARGERQHREVAVVKALGATNRDLARRFLSESLVVALLGGALGLALAYAAVAWRFGFEPGQIPRLQEVRVGGAALAVTAGISIVSALLLGGLSLVRAGRVDFTAALKGALGRMTGGRDWQRAQRVLVAVQVALALTLLIASAMMVQSFWRLAHAPLGFDPQGVLTFEISLDGNQTYQDEARFHARLLERLRAIPGVSAAGATFNTPLTPTALGLTGMLDVENVPRPPDKVSPSIAINVVTPEYFRAMGIPLVRGRTFRTGDLLNGARPAIVSAATVRALFGGQNPIGRQVRLRPSYFPPFTVVGVAGDVAGETIAGGPSRLVYFPDLDDFATQPDTDVNLPQRGVTTIVVRTSLPPTSIVPAVRRVVHDLDPQVPVVLLRTMDDIVAASMARARLMMLLLLVAGGAALVLGVIGLYGVVSYTVARRGREIGVRIALGASPMAVGRLVMWQSAVVVVAGIGVGLAAAFALTRFLGSVLYEVSPRDPKAYGAMTVLLFLVALVASYIPARRAGRVDPVQALKGE